MKKILILLLLTQKTYCNLKLITTVASIPVSAIFYNVNKDKAIAEEF